MAVQPSPSLRGVPKFLKTAGVVLVGLAMIVAGFVYDVMFAGIPFQDPTPEMQANWQFNSNIAFWTRSAGGIILCVGLLLIPLIAHKR